MMKTELRLIAMQQTPGFSKRWSKAIHYGNLWITEYSAWRNDFEGALKYSKHRTYIQATSASKQIV